MKKTTGDLSRMRLLLAEDDAVLADGILEALKQSGYLVDHARTGPDAEQMLSCVPYDTVILDLGLPGFDGLEVLTRLRQSKNQVPVLILTARDTLDDRVLGLDLGADDYLSKPFRLRELEARIRAMVRRKCFSNATELTLGLLRFDTNGRRAYIQDKPVELSAREMDVLEIFLSHSNQVISKQKFIELLCGWEEEITTNAVETYISRVRKKLSGAGVHFRTVWGIGYCLEAGND